MKEIPSGVRAAGKLATANLGLVVSIALVMASAIQVMLMARWSLPTARGIVQEQGSVQVLTGTLFGVVVGFTPAVLVAGVLAPLGASLLAKQPNRIVRLYSWMAAWVSLVLAITIYTVGTLLVWVGVGAMAGLGVGAGEVSRRRRRRRSDAQVSGATEPPTESVRFALHLTSVSAAIAVLFGIPIVIGTTWLPLENIKSADGEVVAAYVLSDDGETVVFLDHRFALIHRAPSSSAHREICEYRRESAPDWLDRRVYELTTESAVYPACSRATLG